MQQNIQPLTPCSEHDTVARHTQGFKVCSLLESTCFKNSLLKCCHHIGLRGCSLQMNYSVTDICAYAKDILHRVRNNTLFIP